MANNQIKIGVGFQIDKTGLNELQNSLKQIQITANNTSNNDKMTQSLREAASAAKVVDTALEKAFNKNLGTTNLSKFNQELKKNNLTIDQVRIKFAEAGQAGSKAWNLLGSQILKTNTQLKQSNKLLDEMATSMANTVKWGITSSIFNTITNSISKAYTYTKKLDGSLNDIRIVTDKSAESMEKFAKQANEAAKGLGASTLDYTEASLIYYQQGLDDAQVAARAETTLKAANVTGQYAEEVSEQLTAVWNGYKVSAEEAELYVDKLAAVAASTAADLEELSTGMSKVASAANSMGVDIDQLNAQLATIVSVTRQAPESVGTALKTIYARMSDLKVGGTDEDGLGLGDVSGTMESMGIQVLDASGNLREMGDVIEEVAAKWDTWTDAQKTAMAQVMAGKRQYNNLVALFDNWDMYTDSLNESANAAGTLQKQQEIYLESTNAKLQQLRTTAESVYSGLIKTDELNTGIELLTDFTQVASNFVNSFGGGIKSISSLLLIVANIFNKQLANGINNVIIGHKKAVDNAELYRQKAEQLKAISQKQTNLNTIEGIKSAAIAEGYQKQAEYAQKLQDIQHNLNQEEYNRLNTLTAEVGELTEQITLLQEGAKFTSKNIIDENKIEKVFAGEENFESDISNTSNQIEVENKKLKIAQDLDTTYKDIKKQVSDITQANLVDFDLNQKEQKYISNILKAKKDGYISEENANKKIQNFLTKQKKINQDNIKLHQQKIKQLKIEKDTMEQIQEMASQKQRFEAEKDIKESDLNEGLDIGQQSANVLKGVTQVTSALSTMAMSWMSINSLIDTWGDKSLSIGQKLSQTLMTVGMTLPMLISSFKSLSEVMGVQTGLFETFNALRLKNTALTATELTLSKSEIAAKSADLVITNKAAMVQAIKNKDDILAISLLGSATVAELAKTGATEADVIAMIKAKLAQDAWNTSMLASPFTWIVLGLTAVVGAIALYNKVTLTAEERAEKAAEQQKQLQDAYSETTKKYNELITAINKYQSSEDALNKLTKGTEEWRNAVFDLNQQVLELMQRYPELAGAINDVNGQLVLDTESEIYQNFIEKQQQQQQAAYRATLAGTEKVNEANIDKEISDLKIRYTSQNQASTSSAIGSNQILDSTKLASLDAKRTAINLLSNNSSLAYSKEAFTEAMKNTEYGNNSELIAALWSTKDELLNLANSIKDNTHSNEILASQKYTSKLQNININEKDFSDYKYSGLITQAAVNFENSIEAQNLKQTEEQKLKKQSESEIKTLYKDKFGASDEILENLDKDTMIQALVSETVADFVVNAIDPQKIANDIATLEKDKIGKEVLDFLNNDTNVLTPEQVESFKQKNITEILKIYDENKEIFASMGYESAQQFVDSYQNKMQEYDPVAYWDSKASQIKAKLDVVNESISKMLSGETLSTEEIEALERAFPELARIVDKNSQAYLETLQNIQESHEIAYNESALEGLNSAYKNLQESVAEYEDAVENSSDKVGEYLQNIKTQLADIYDREYELQVAQVDEILTDVDKLVNLADGLQVAFESIGNGFQVAAGKSAELFEIFPELSRNAEVLANGTIQLDKEVVNTVLKNNGQIIDSDKEVLKAAIENKIKELDLEEEKLIAEIERIEAMTAKEFEQSGIIQEISKTQASNEVTIDEQKSQDMIANDGATTTAIIDNWSKKIEAAKVYAKVVKAAMRGELLDIDASKFGINTTVDTQNTVQDVEIDNDALWEDLRQQHLDSLYNQLELTRDSRSKLLTGASEMMAETSTKYTEAMNKNQSDNKDKKEQKKAKDEIDRYWELNKAIENVEESLSDLDKKQDKLYGKELIASLKQENQLLAQQADRYQALAAAQRQEASELQGLLSSYGVVFDAQGGVANYLAATQAALETYNQAVAAYNAMLIDEATFQAAERAYENFKSTLARYETLYYQEMIDTQNKLEEIHRQELENNLQAWEVEIQLKLDMNELERQWDDFFKDINKNFKLLYEDLDAEMSNLMDKTLTYQGGDGDIATIISGIKDVTAEIDKMQSGGESGMFESVSQAQEKLKELNDQLQDSALAMRELWETAWDTYLEGIDQAADKLDDLMDRYDSINEEIEYQRELIELLYGDEAYELMNQYYDAQEKNTKAEIDSLKIQADLWKAQYEEALAIDEANGTLSEDTQKFYELWQDAQQGLNDKVTEYIELLQNDYKNTISDIISDLEKSITGGAALDEVKEQWELLKEQSEKYYDDVERIYELSSLASKYENSIINTSNLENQQKLQEMYNKEMKYLENKKFLSEYDLQVANAKYDMTLKQIMLEEAQQNKTSMKLTRGADGNWSYQYVADEDDIASKQQALLDATSQYYQITKDGYHQNLEDMMSAQANYLEKLQEINEKYMNDEEMRAAKAQELYEIYYGEEGILTLLYIQNEEARTNMADSTLQSILTFYAIDEENYALMTEAEQALIDGLKDGTITNYEEMLDKATQVCEDTLSSWESSAQGIADAWYVDNGYSVKASMLQAYKDLTKANTDYQTAVDILEKSVEQDFGPEGIGGALDSTKNKTEELDNKTAELCNHAESNLTRYREAVNQIGYAWESVKDQIRSAISLVQQYLNAVGAAQSAAMSGLASAGGIGSSGGTGGSGSGGGSKNSNEKYYYVQTGSGTDGAKFSVYNSAGQSVSGGLSKDLEWIQKNYPNATLKGNLYNNNGTAFNTGGYTGEWNNGHIDGRLAWLHQKELVLNSSDTENILDAVHTVRGIANIGDSINDSIMNGISQMVLSLMNLGNYGKGYNLATAEGSQESVFNINANFPNANDVESIREAIMSLPNLASQYIARNRK